MAAEDGGKNVTRTSADVRDVGVGGEVVGGCDGGCIRDVMADEQVAEHGGFLGIAGEVVEEGDAEVLIERGLAGLDGVKEFRPGDDEEISGDGENGRTNGAGNVGPEGLGERSQGESVGFVLAEDAVTGEGAQEAVERGGVGVGEGCELFGGFGTVGEMVSQAQLGGCAQKKWDGEAHRH